MNSEIENRKSQIANQIDSFILIGGRSSRFGSPKALLKLDGQPLLDRTAETLTAALPETRITLVASAPEQFLGLGTNLPFIFDLYPERGPVGGLHAALAYARTEWIFVTACDYPFISIELLQFLKSQIDDNHDAIVPIQPDGRLQPLCAFYRTKPCLKTIEEMVQPNRPTPPLRTIFDHVRVCLVPFEEISHLPDAENFFLNINTPSDLNSAWEIEDKGVS
jgi:molybdopterin-guanine dinucleotide biosynthesis protein A